MFETFETAAEALLHTTCDVLRKRQIKFVIVGGWSPFLRGSRTGLKHPGTRDVDVLFDEEHRDIVEGAIKEMLAEGFYVSAKHAFQLLMPLRVGDRDFIFNVDFMHPSEQRTDPELMADIFDLGVPDDGDPTGRRWFKSIVFQSAQLVFQRKLFSFIDRGGIGIGGSQVNSKIPLLDETGLVLSKLESVKQKKRPRDAFDIYFALAGQSGHTAAARIQELADEIEEVGTCLSKFKSWLNENTHTFDTNIGRYFNFAADERPSSFVQKMLQDGLPRSDRA